MKKTKVLCIQPHSDDILFSASHFLFFSDKYQTEILTIENNEKRVKEDEKLYEFLGIPYQHLNVSFDDQSFYGFHKKYTDLTIDNAIEWLTEFFGEEKIKEISSAIVKFIKAYRKKNKDTIIVLPWGVGHPFHLFVRHVVENICDNCLYYRDFPHSYKKRAGNQVKAQLQDFVLEESIPVKEFADIKWDLAKKFYKSQSGLLWFEQGYIRKQLPEDIYKRK